MKYVALLRGINVGTSQRIDMKQLRESFLNLGYTNVSTYINSGNVIFETQKTPENILSEIQKALKKVFSQTIETLVISHKDMRRIARAIPDTWKNDATQKTDVAYLFPEINKKAIIKEPPFNQEFVTVRYVKGALIWNVSRAHYGRGRLTSLCDTPTTN